MTDNQGPTHSSLSISTVDSQENLFPHSDNIIAEIPDDLIEAEYIKRNCIQPGERFNGSASVAKHLQTHFVKEQDREHLIVLFLNGQHCLLESKVMFTGSLTTSAIYPREIIKDVILIKAAAIVVGHNHPSGETNPSSSDRAVTKKLQTALQSIDVNLLDHVIVGYGSRQFFSFADNNLI